MAHYAFLDKNNIVVDIICGKEEWEDGIDWEEYYGNIRNVKCKRTSYNTRAGKHPNGNPFRKNYAGIGFTYNEELNAFIPPKPYNSWILNEETCLWEPPIPCPNNEINYTWNEFSLSWVIV